MHWLMQSLQKKTSGLYLKLIRGLKNNFLILKKHLQKLYFMLNTNGQKFFEGGS